jgi:hypothetical protein
MRKRRRDGAELHFDATFEQIERRLCGAAIRQLVALVHSNGLYQLLDGPAKAPTVP